MQDIELVAFHEAGHAIVGGLLPEYDTVTKIGIVPRVSGAGGLTFFSPLEDRLDNVVTRHYLESDCCRVGRSPCRGACIRSRKSYYGRLG